MFFAGDAFGQHDAFGRRQVSQLRMAGSIERDDIANGGDAGNVRSEITAHVDVAAFEAKTGVFGPEPGCDWSTPGRDEQILGADLRGLSIWRLRFEVYSVLRGSCAGDTRPGQHLDALFSKRSFQLGGDRFVFDRNDSRKQLNDRDLAAEPPEDRSELDADGTAPHDRDRLRHVLQPDRFVAGDDSLAIEFDSRHAAWL